MGYLKIAKSNVPVIQSLQGKIVTISRCICCFFLNIAHCRLLLLPFYGMFRAAKGGGTMESIIEELFYGNITPSERSYHKADEYAHIL